MSGALVYEAIMSTILVIDDDPHIRQVVEFSLGKAGFDVVLAEDGAAGLEAFRAHAPALVVLDILMPELDGLAVCRELRATSRVPVIFLTSIDEELDRVVGLELGADDYVTKPFSPRELVARVKAVLRRSAPAAPDDEARPMLEYGALRVDRDRREVRVGESEVELTATEFNILVTLLAMPGKVYSRGELMQRAYSDDTVVSERTIDSHVKRIRKKFEVTGVQPVETVHGVGYRMARW